MKQLSRAFSYFSKFELALWILASRENTSYVSVTVCFAAFLLNDAYGFYNWKRMERQQKAAPPDKS